MPHTNRPYLPVRAIDCSEWDTISKSVFYASPEDEIRMQIAIDRPMFVVSEKTIEEYRDKDKLNYKEFRSIIGFFKRQCMYCEETHVAALDFHHRDGTDKHFSVSQFWRKHRRIGDGLSVHMLFEEIAKCDVLCANCHRKVTYPQRQDDYQWEYEWEDYKTEERKRQELEYLLDLVD